MAGSLTLGVCVDKMGFIAATAVFLRAPTFYFPASQIIEWIFLLVILCDVLS